MSRAKDNPYSETPTKELIARLRTSRDPETLYHLACILEQMGEPLESLRTFNAALTAGYRNLDRVKEFLEDGFFATQHETQEYQNAKAMAKRIVVGE